MGLVSSGTKLSAGRSFFSNVDDAARIVPLNQYGNFGFKSKKKGSKSRIFEADNPARTAYDFQSRAARGYVSMTRIRWGQVMTMSDGTIITYRMRSSSRDHTPVVELQVHNMPGVRSQKIHFIPRGTNARR